MLLYYAKLFAPWNFILTITNPKKEALHLQVRAWQSGYLCQCSLPLQLFSRCSWSMTSPDRRLSDSVKRGHVFTSWITLSEHSVGTTCRRGKYDGRFQNAANVETYPRCECHEIHQVIIEVRVHSRLTPKFSFTVQVVEMAVFLIRNWLAGLPFKYCLFPQRT